MKIGIAPLGALGTNCYFVVDEASKRCLLVDPGAEGEHVEEILKQKGWTLDKIVLTHGHADHIGGVQHLVDTFHVPVYMHPADASYLTDASLNLSQYTGAPVSVQGDIHYVHDGDTIPCGDITLTVLETPGHTPGGICLYTEGTLFSGDTLFAESVGRTDFPGGSMETIVTSIREKLYDLPEDTDVYPGHGPATSIGHEKVYNPFTR